MFDEDFTNQVGRRMRLIMFAYEHSGDLESPEADPYWVQACVDMAIGFLEPREGGFSESDKLTIAYDAVEFIRARIKRLSERQ